LWYCPETRDGRSGEITRKACILLVSSEREGKKGDSQGGRNRRFRSPWATRPSRLSLSFIFSIAGRSPYFHTLFEFGAANLSAGF
jgi:hypothetical protein